MTSEGITTWRLGIDAGENSVGLAAIGYNLQGDPQSILSAVSYIHDGGKDPDGQVAQSRKSTAGVARRTRRLRSRRKKRLLRTSQTLTKLGCQVPPIDRTETYEPWQARSRLVREYIDDDSERSRQLGLALMHMSRFRGWRNPWSSIEKLATLERPTASLVNMIDSAVQRGLCSHGTISTIGELGYLGALVPGTRVRPQVSSASQSSSSSSSGGVSLENQAKWLLFEQVRQEDILLELELICKRQRLGTEFFLSVRDTLFEQRKPSVTAELVGIDPFDRTYRALRASLEFQEYRVRDKVANLRLLESGEKRRLGQILHEDIAQFLLTWRQSTPPTWIEVAEKFGLPDGILKTDDANGMPSTRAPIDVTSIEIEKAKGIPTILKWWDGNTGDRADLVSYLAEPVETELPESISSLLDSLSEDEHLALEKLSFQSGRSSYSRASLSKLNIAMRDNFCDLTTARMIVFNVDQFWVPPKSSFAEQTGQPVVDRNLAIARRFVMASIEKWGPPERVVIEHTREAFMSPMKLKELKREQGQRRRINDEIRAELISAGKEPNQRNIRKQKLLQTQNSTCLYCGTALSFESSELDHIVPRAGGGANKASNLVAVCRRCNAEKNRTPFATWAKQSPRLEVTLEEAIRRVNDWQRIERQLTSAAFMRYKSDVKARLRRTSEDDPLDERSLASTAYAAGEIRERVERYLEAQPDWNLDDHTLKVLVFNGRCTSLARGASGLSRTLQLRSRDEKTRLDRRHHAIDAAILTTLSPAIARVLVERDDAYQADRYEINAGIDLQTFTGRQAGDQILYSRWKASTPRLAELLKAAVAADRINVINPLRLRPEIGSVHKDTVQPLVKKSLGESFLPNEIRRVTDHRVYEVLVTELASGPSIPQNANRTARNEFGSLLTDESLITLFKPGGAAMLSVQGGAVELGSVHHSRVYAWRTSRGTLTFGMIRVFGGEFGRIGFRKSNVDILTAPLPRWSESWRLAESRVTDNILTGKAIQVGWLAPGDEVEFSSAKHVPGTGEIRAFLEIYGERRWRIDGFPSEARLRLRPLYLAGEGVTENPPDSVRTLVLGRGWWPSIDVAFKDTGIRILRRTSLGRPRWTGEALPLSWQPHLIAMRLLP